MGGEVEMIGGFVGLFYVHMSVTERQFDMSKTKRWRDGARQMKRGKVSLCDAVQSLFG